MLTQTYNLIRPVKAGIFLMVNTGFRVVVSAGY